MVTTAKITQLEKLHGPHRDRSFPSRLIFGLVAAIIAACQPIKAPPSLSEYVCRTPTRKNIARLTEPADPRFGLLDSTPNWQDDIEPLLRASEPPRKYKCLVCHSAYTYDVVSTPKKAEKIIAAVKSHSMPPKAPKMQPADIALIEAWQLAGFPQNAADGSGGNSIDDNSSSDQPGTNGVDSILDTDATDPFAADVQNSRDARARSNDATGSDGC